MKRFICYFFVFLLGLITMYFISSLIKNRAPKNDFKYFGSIGGHKIYAANVVLSGHEKESPSFMIKLDDNIIYSEEDKNRDNKIDRINYLYNDLLVFSLADNDYDGYLNARQVESYKSDGEHYNTLIDLNADNIFDFKINHNIGTKDNVEIFFENSWINAVMKNKKNFIKIDGQLVSVHFKDGVWNRK